MKAVAEKMKKKQKGISKKKYRRFQFHFGIKYTHFFSHLDLSLLFRSKKFRRDFLFDEHTNQTNFVYHFNSFSVRTFKFGFSFSVIYLFFFVGLSFVDLKSHLIKINTMKLTFLIELLLILVIIAFAASKPIDNGNYDE